MGAGGSSRRNPPRAPTVTSEAWETQGAVSDISNLGHHTDYVTEFRAPDSPSPPPQPKRTQVGVERISVGHGKKRQKEKELGKNRNVSPREKIRVKKDPGMPLKQGTAALAPLSFPKIAENKISPEPKRRKEKYKKQAEESRRPHSVYEVPESSSSDQDVGAILSQLEADLPSLPSAPPPSLVQSRSQSQVLSLSESAISNSGGTPTEHAYRRLNGSGSASSARNSASRRKHVAKNGAKRSEQTMLYRDLEQERRTGLLDRDPKDWDIDTKPIEGFDLDKFQAANQTKRKKKEEPVFDYDYECDIDYFEELTRSNRDAESQIQYSNKEQDMLASIEREFGKQ